MICIIIWQRRTCCFIQAFSPAASCPGYCRRGSSSHRRCTPAAARHEAPRAAQQPEQQQRCMFYKLPDHPDECPASTQDNSGSHLLTWHKAEVLLTRHTVQNNQFHMMHTQHAVLYCPNTAAHRAPKARHTRPSAAMTSSCTSGCCSCCPPHPPHRLHHLLHPVSILSALLQRGSHACAHLPTAASTPLPTMSPIRAPATGSSATPKYTSTSPNPRSVHRIVLLSFSLLVSSIQ